MKTATLTILILILTFSFSKAQTDCKKAIEQARKDFMKSDFSFHSPEILPAENTYFYVLKKYYNINWYFTDSLKYYSCYDSIMTINLKCKYGSDFLVKARMLADSLQNTKNWISNPEYYGGHQGLLEFFMTQFSTINFAEVMDSITTKLYIELEIDSTGKVVNPKIIRGIGEKTDKKVIEIIGKMPNWKPAYLYGKPIRQKYYIPLNLDYQ